MEKEYTISLVEDKNKDWKIVTLEVVEGDGSVMYEDVSVNRVNKKGEIFPNFDNIKVGERVKGNLWSSSAGKRYLFAPSPIKTQGGANKASGGYKTQVIKEAQETKRKDIETAQENKGQSIKISSTMRDAVLLTIAEKGDGVMTAEDMEENIIKWRKWLVNHWEDADIPF